MKRKTLKDEEESCNNDINFHFFIIKTVQSIKKYEINFVLEF